MDTDLLKNDLEPAPACAGGRPAADAGSVTGLIRAGERELALDMLCTQTSENDLEVGEEQRSPRVRLGRQLDVSAEPW